jgi:ketosteroid isomerase-like protein
MHAMPPLLASVVVHYVLENPWPLAALLAVAAGLLVHRARGTGERQPLFVALGLAGAAVVVVLLATVVTTRGERAEAIVREFVARAERADTSGMLSLLSDNATLHFGRPENPGVGRDEIRSMLSDLEGRYRIESNTITQLDATGEPGPAATVLLTNRTSVAAGYDGVPNSWWLRVGEQKDGSWKIERIAFLKAAGQPGSPGLWR